MIKYVKGIDNLFLKTENVGKTIEKMEVKRIHFKIESSNYFYSPSDICNSYSIRSLRGKQNFFHFNFSSLTTQCAALLLLVFLSVFPHPFESTFLFSPTNV